jgi:hypothetical protein
MNSGGGINMRSVNNYDMQTETNIDLLSRDDGVDLGMGRVSVRSSDDLDDSGKSGKRGIKTKMSGKKAAGKAGAGNPACNSCEQVCTIF